MPGLGQLKPIQWWRATTLSTLGGIPLDLKYVMTARPGSLIGPHLENTINRIFLGDDEITCRERQVWRQRCELDTGICCAISVLVVIQIARIGFIENT